MMQQRRLFTLKRQNGLAQLEKQVTEKLEQILLYLYKKSITCFQFKIFQTDSPLATRRLETGALSTGVGE